MQGAQYMTWENVWLADSNLLKSQEALLYFACYNRPWERSLSKLFHTHLRHILQSPYNRAFTDRRGSDTESGLGNGEIWVTVDVLHGQNSLGWLLMVDLWDVDSAFHPAMFTLKVLPTPVCIFCLMHKIELLHRYKSCQAQMYSGTRQSGILGQSSMQGGPKCAEPFYWRLKGCSWTDLEHTTGQGKDKRLTRKQNLYF